MKLKNKKKHKIIFSFICPIFDTRVRLFIGDAKLFKEFKDKEDLNTRSGALYKIEKSTGDTEFAVWVGDKKDFMVMIHETLHLVKEIFALVGVKFEPTNDELIAYYQNYWVRKFWNKMGRFVKN